MDTLSLGLGAGSPRAWWPAGAVYAADFVNRRFMRNGAPISAADAMSFSRSTPKWAVDSTGQWRQFAPNEPAITDLGLSIEPAGTNLVPNPGLAGASVGVVGAGGSLPTGWWHNGTLTTEVVAITTLMGLPALHARVSGVASGTFYELSVMPVATPIQPSTPYVASVFVQMLEGPAPLLQLRQASAGDAQVAGLSLVPVPSAVVMRASSTFESQPTAVQCRMRIGAVTVVDQPVAFSMLLSAPQLELGGKMTGPLLTPRGADFAGLVVGTHVVSLTARYDDGSTSSLGSVSGTHVLDTNLPRSTVRQAVGLLV